MATRNVTRASAAPLPQSAPPAKPQRADTPDPTGYLTENWVKGDSSPPALVLNPEASTGVLLAWCWSEVRVLEVTTRTWYDALTAEDGTVEPDDFAVMFMHRLAPLERVLEHIAARMHREEQTD